MMIYQAELVLDVQAELGEGIFWHPIEHCLYWLDIEGCSLNKFDPKTRINLAEQLDRQVGCVVPTTEKSLLLAGEGGIEEYWSETEEWAFLANPEEDKPNNRLNDGKASPDGRFWFGSLNRNHEKNQAAFYVMEHDGTVRRILTGLTNSNGIGWSPNGETLYHIDTPTRQVSAFDYDAEHGDICNRRTLVQFPESPEYGNPDGMTVDAEGMLWIAHWGGSRVTRWNPTSGEIIAAVNVPASQVTSVAFGGENFDTLYITTARRSLSLESLRRQAYAGGLFAVTPGVAGLPTHFFQWEED
ncbi:MAG: SMP-30/gluconolactonase/LRE family protein [Planctomycetaceae bacterium]|jgi:sugar lactone lactonase YvrE|nr:SMP-30/gluconolactonase/LRE family protein [Planctomycetaceae bacterium]